MGAAVAIPLDVAFSLIKRHPVVAEILEWSFAASVGLLLTVGSLIANA